MEACAEATAALPASRSSETDNRMVMRNIFVVSLVANVDKTDS
jgi:hypothetical protein